MSCGSTPSPPKRAIVSAMRLPVTAFMFAETIGCEPPRKVGRREVRVEARAAVEVAGVQEDVVGGELELFVVLGMEEAHALAISQGGSPREGKRPRARQSGVRESRRRPRRTSDGQSSARLGVTPTHEERHSVLPGRLGGRRVGVDCDVGTSAVLSSADAARPRRPGPGLRQDRPRAVFQVALLLQARREIDWRECLTAARTGGATRSPSYLEPVSRWRASRLSDLLGIEEQKGVVEANTRQFLAGYPANNVLLWGTRGTGKSSLVRALLRAYAPEGLRIIQVDKDDLVSLPQSSTRSPGQPYRFILFSERRLVRGRANASYKMLKSALDGSVYAPPDNVLIYVTSNRRHLVPGFETDNLGALLVNNEIHHGEAVEEKISLSGRFGIWVGFHAFSQDEYVAVARQWVAKLAEKSGAKLEWTRQAADAAVAWSHQKGDRSGRNRLSVRERLGRAEPASLALTGDRLIFGRLCCWRSGRDRPPAAARPRRGSDRLQEGSRNYRGGQRVCTSSGLPGPVARQTTSTVPVRHGGVVAVHGPARIAMALIPVQALPVTSLCSRRTSSRGSILIVEDDLDIREALAEALGFEGYDVFLAENGGGARRAPRWSPPPRHPPRPAHARHELVAVPPGAARGPSPRGHSRDCRVRLGAGDARADRYLPKPFCIDELLSAVAELSRTICSEAASFGRRGSGRSLRRSPCARRTPRRAGASARRPARRTASTGTPAPRPTSA